MTYKKNWGSVCLWAFYAFAVFVCYAKALYDVLQAPHVTNHYIQFGIVFLSFALVAAVFIQIRRLTKLLKRPVHVLWEALFFILLFAAGVFLRIYFIGRGTEHAAYFETAMVNGSPVTALAHGAQYFYVLLLRGLFLLTGNHFMAGIILQICLQMLAAGVWYLAVKKLSGRTAALVLFGGLMLMPANIEEGLLYSPKMLYMLLCGIVLLMIGRVCRRQSRSAVFQWHAWLQTALTGVGIGVLTYLDVSGLLFLVPVLFLPFLKEEVRDGESVPKGKMLGRAVLQLLLIIIFTFGAFGFLLYMDALQNGAGIQQVFVTWRTLFSRKEISGFPEILKAGTVLEAWVFVALSFLMLLGVLAFFVRRKEEMQIPWLFFAVAAAALYAGGFCAAGMDCEYMLLTAALLLAGTGMQAAFCRTELAEALEDNEETPPEEKEQAKEEGKELSKEEEREQSKEEEREQAKEEEREQAGEEEKEQLREEEKEQPKEEEPIKASGEETPVKAEELPKEQNQTESDVSQMSSNSEYEGSTNKGEQDSLWALFAGDDGTTKPSGSEPKKAGGKKAEGKKVKEKEKKAKEKKEKPPKKSAEDRKAAKPAEEKPAAAVQDLQEKPEEKKKNYIENPLPLPKKHVKKTMNYQTELTPDKMDFDIDIPESDDFDI